MSTIETANKLREAAALIGENGHAIGSFETSDGALCLQGALCKAHYGDADHMMQIEDYASMRALEAVLPNVCTEHYPAGHALDHNEAVYHWNDWHCDGGGDAIEVLVQAAEKIEADL